MRCYHKVSELKVALKGQYSIGFVPTMGALHEGHLSLVRKSQSENDLTVVSIFVNPTQFAPHEDFESYPRETDADLSQLDVLGVDIVFNPKQEEIYPKDVSTSGFVSSLSSGLCGEIRPHFFGGVCQVVHRLFEIIEPKRAYFGEKDYQQLCIITDMVESLGLPIHVIGCPIIRETSGLAMSSRNQYLTDKQRELASHIHQGMNAVQAQFLLGKVDPVALIQGMTQFLDGNFKVDYIKIVDPKSLESVAVVRRGDRLMIAVYLNDIRLIDNRALG